MALATDLHHHEIVIVDVHFHRIIHTWSMFVGVCAIGLSRPDNWILIPLSYIAYGLLINLAAVLRSRNHS